MGVKLKMITRLAFSLHKSRHLKFADQQSHGSERTKKISKWCLDLVQSKVQLIIMQLDINCQCSGISKYNGQTLRLTNVRRDQMGAFMCIARNNVPPAVSRRIVLNVHCK